MLRRKGGTHLGLMDSLFLSDCASHARCIVETNLSAMGMPSMLGCSCLPALPCPFVSWGDRAGLSDVGR
jgi:hypothetical protein